jgi:hypothetical protein
VVPFAGGGGYPPGAPEEDADEPINASAPRKLTSMGESVRVPHSRETREVSICAGGRARSLAPVASSFRMAGLEDAAEDLLERLGDIG